MNIILKPQFLGRIVIDSATLSLLLLTNVQCELFSPANSLLLCTLCRNKTGSTIHTMCLRPYHVENASFCPIAEAKQRQAQLVLGWVTTWEYWVL